MTTINEVYEELKQEVEEVYNDKHRQEVLNTIDDIIIALNWWINRFQDYWVDELTRIWGRLAIYQYNLIEYEQQAFKNYRKAELEVKVKRNSIRQQLLSEKSEKKITAKEVDVKVEAMLVKSEMLLSLYESEFNKLTSIKFSINMIVNRIESRIKYLISDINPRFKNG